MRKSGTPSGPARQTSVGIVLMTSRRRSSDFLISSNAFRSASAAAYCSVTSTCVPTNSTLRRRGRRPDARRNARALSSRREKLSENQSRSPLCPGWPGGTTSMIRRRSSGKIRSRKPSSRGAALFRVEPEQLICFGGPIHEFLAAHVPGPTARMTEALGLGQIGLAASQPPFHLLCGRHIRHGPDELDAARRISPGATIRRDIFHRAIRHQQSMFVVEILCLAGRLMKGSFARQPDLPDGHRWAMNSTLGPVTRSHWKIRKVSSDQIISPVATFQPKLPVRLIPAPGSNRLGASAERFPPACAR